MDALALLCTLHADGPQTLKRLRSAGCDSLQVLESFDPAALARLLDIAPSVARRLAREARLLSQRVDLDAEADCEEAPCFQSQAPAEAISDARAPGGARPDQLEPRDREILGKVMDRWRDADAEAASGLDFESAADEGLEAAEAEWGDPVLQADDLDGLSSSDVDGLAHAGVETLQELIDCDSLTAALAANLPFAALKRFQILARRQLGEVQAESEAETEEVESGFSPADEVVLVAEAPGEPEETAALAELDQGTVLDWNFEIPPPPSAAPAGYDDPSGPFA